MPTTSDGRADRLQGFARLFELAPFVGVKWGLGVLRRRLKYKEIKCCKAFRGCHRLVYCPNLTKKERIMDPDNKKRISIYMDKDIVEKADKALMVCGCSSRNELVAKAIEYYISEKEIEGASQYLVTRISKSIAQANDVTLKQVTTGLHRYAIYLDMMIQMLGQVLDYDEEDIRKMCSEAYRHLKSVNGKVTFESIMNHSLGLGETFDE